ncbi:MAG TPA: RdgB/HAM1 family non-canonical purine NTP pyrophosphatase [Hellea balneolensis]|uniref:dITP/XTP pyrophosphatase n=1 Tax=Hellea balneolensis TaxID=287478 RepID=A0A7C5LTA1_9PROT|nr:RdgB/HAM1 family non-canonical purine NTP pyrophosphatase [Hellea balneolensis]
MVTPIKELVVASHNAGKVREIRDLLAPFGVKTYSAQELGLSDVEETGTTFAENAALKAQSAARESGKIALSDDSGLAVNVLDGAPGIHSARWAEQAGSGGRDFALAMAALVEKMRGKEAFKMHNTGAQFICALALALPHSDEKNQEVFVYEGKVEGDIIWPPRGDKGFGYDPIFVAKGDILSFAELEPEIKHAKSHRADAFAKFITAWFGDA